MAELKDNRRENGKLSLRPLKFEEAVRDLIQVSPSPSRDSDKEERHGREKDTPKN